MKLYTNKAFGNLFVDVVAVTASLSGVQLTEEVVSEEVAKSKEFKAKSLTGKFPLLETEQGTIVESAAIAKFIAKHSANNLVGSNNWETAQVDQFTDFASTSLIPHIRVIAQAIFGHGSIETEAFNNSVKELKEHVRVLNTHLQGKTYLVGDRLTVADVQVAFSLILAFQVALDGGFRKSVAPNVTAWLERFVALPEVVKRVGHVKFCAKPQKAVAPPKKEEEKKPAAAAAPKKEADAESAPIKAVDPLDELPPSKFDLMAFKTYFVNLPNDVKKTEGIDFFFKNYDNEGYCLYYAKYDKYEGEGEVLYQTSNLMNGFLQRIDSFRRHTFAMMAIVGEVPNLDIESVWLFRGKGIPQQMIDHPQFEYYNKRELSLDNEADKQLVKEFFCAQAGDTVNGKVVVECKAHK